jgi:hypothetical protein
MPNRRFYGVLGSTLNSEMIAKNRAIPASSGPRLKDIAQIMLDFKGNF